MNNADEMPIRSTQTQGPMQRQLSSPANDDHHDALPRHAPHPHHLAPPCLNLTFTQLPLHPAVRRAP